MTWALCRDCDALAHDLGPGERCRVCRSPRLVCHPELRRLTLAHIDCDAFYAAVEKRDAPELIHKPVIVGGGRRGVVSAACYVARTYGVHSAMPMFKARKLCPDAVVLRPDIDRYRAASREVRALMLELTPLVEPLSLDEAFLDLSNTERLHRSSAAEMLARLGRRIEAEVGVTVSVGLSYNKFLAKLASDLDKPRGFAVIGRREARDFLAPLSVGRIWGVGPVLKRRLAGDGIVTIDQLARASEDGLVARYGSIGRRLARFARGEDDRAVEPNAPPKSLSAETTFGSDLTQLAELEAILWPLCEKLAGRLKRAGLGATTLTLKLKTADFRLRGRSRRLGGPTQLADVLYRGAQPLLAGEADGTPFRLIGIGASGLVSGSEADLPDLLNPEAARRAEVERAIDAVRAKLGPAAIQRGRDLKLEQAPPANSPSRAGPRAGSVRRRR